jgi:tetratricopeptide (TPR) repeat protein
MNRMIRMSPVRLLGLVFLLVETSGAAAQQLQLKRTLPGIAWAGCPSPDGRRVTVTPAQRQDAERLAEAATQASLLGDKAAALDLLTRAAGVDATSKTIAYHVARTLDELNRPNEALVAYCRYLALAPDASDAQEVRDRTRVLATPAGFAVSAAAARAYEAGIAHYDGGRLAEAETAFGQASAAAPAWANAVYNRAVIRLALGRTDPAAEDLRRYLELSPGAPDFNQLLDLLATFRQVVPPPYNPSSVLVRGLLVPGLGHFTTGRSGAGVLFLGAASSALAAGFAVTRQEVDCLSPPVNGRCPADQIASQKTRRPYLVPGIAAAAAIGVWGAIDAYRGAGKRNAEASRSLRVGLDGRSRGPSLVSPSLTVGLHNAQFDLIRVRF